MARRSACARAPSLLCKPVLHVSLVSHHTSLPFLPLSCILPCPFYTARYLRFDKLEIAAPATLMVLTLLVKRWTRVAANDAPNINGRTCTRATLCWLFFSSLWLSALVWFRLVSCRERTKLTKRFQRYRRLWFMAIRHIILCGLCRDRIWCMDGTQGDGAERRECSNGFWCVYMKTWRWRNASSRVRWFSVYRFCWRESLPRIRALFPWEWRELSRTNWIVSGKLSFFFSLDSSRVDFDRDTPRLVDSLHVEYLSKVRHALRFEYYFTIVFDDGNTVSMVVRKFLVQCLIDEQTDKTLLQIKLYLVIWEQQGVANIYIKVWIK